jgi:hypothetical protein
MSIVCSNLAPPGPAGIACRTRCLSGRLLRNICPSPAGGAGAVLLRRNRVTAVQIGGYAVGALPGPGGHGTCPTARHQHLRVRCFPTLTTRELHRTCSGRVEPAGGSSHCTIRVPHRPARRRCGGGNDPRPVRATQSCRRFDNVGSCNDPLDPLPHRRSGLWAWSGAPL